MKSRTPNQSTLPSQPNEIPWEIGKGSHHQRHGAKANASPSDTTTTGKAGKQPAASGKNNEPTAAPQVASPHVGVLVIDEEQKIVSANDDSATIFGWSNLVGQEVRILLRGGLGNEFGRLLQQKTPSNGRPARFSMRVMALKKGGKEFPASVIVTRNTSGSKTTWTAVFQELEPGARFEGHTAFLRNTAQDLEKRFKSAADEAQSYRECLEKAEEERNELQQRLLEATAAKEELERQLENNTVSQQELTRTIQHLRDQVDAAHAAARSEERNFQSEAAQCDRLKEEIVCLRQVCDELTERLTAEQQEATQAKQRVEDITERLASDHQKLAYAKQRTDDLEQRVANEQRQCEELRLTAEALEQKLQEAQSLPPVDSSIESMRDEIKRLRETEAAQLTELAELESRHHESSAALARATAELEKERRERRRREQRSAALAGQLQEMHEEMKRHLASEKSAQDLLSDLEERLQASESQMARLKADLQKESSDRQLAEEQLQASGDLKSQLEQYRSLFEESKLTFKRAQEDLESRLQSNQSSLAEKESALQKESNERQRLADELAKTKSDLQGQCDRTTTELARVQTELQVEQLERKRLEGDAAQSRYVSIDSARVSRALVNRLQRDIRPSIEEILESARKLLERDLPEDQKSLAETLLEKALLVQTNLQESGAHASPAAGSEGDHGAPGAQEKAA